MNFRILIVILTTISKVFSYGIEISNHTREHYQREGYPYDRTCASCKNCVTSKHCIWMHYNFREVANMIEGPDPYKVYECVILASENSKPCLTMDVPSNFDQSMYSRSIT